MLDETQKKIKTSFRKSFKDKGNMVLYSFTLDWTTWKMIFFNRYKKVKQGLFKEIVTYFVIVMYVCAEAF